MARILFAITRHDQPTAISYMAVKHSLKKANRLGHNIIVLDNKDFTRENFLGTLISMDPEVVIAEAHGDYDKLGGYMNQVVIESENADLLRGRVCWILSCRTAKKLGEEAVKHGCKAYIGFKEDFVFTVKSWEDPLTDEFGKWFFNPVITSINTLLEGKETGEAFEKAREEYEKAIEYWSSNPSEVSSFICMALAHDMDNLVILGSRTTRITVPEKQEETIITKIVTISPKMIPVLGFFGFIVGYLIKDTKEKIGGRKHG